MDKNQAEFRRELADIAKRVSALEQANLHSAAGALAPQAAPDRTPIDGQDEFWALNELRASLPEHPATADGVVMIVGSMTLPYGAPVEWQQAAATTGMFETEWVDHAAAFAALGHPVRLELLRHIMSGVHQTAELAEIASLGTTGQLHHHLRQLVAAGWVRQSGRGSYEVPAARIVPLLASVMGAQR